MHILLAFIVGIALIAEFRPIQEPPKNELQIQAGDHGEVTIRENVKTLKEMESLNVVEQAYDYSCGSASLATVLKYYLGEELDERQVIQGLLRYGDHEQIARRRAFSLLDMKKFITVLGYRGVGYKAGIEDLKELDKPCIIPIRVFDYRHFTVFRGIHNGRIFLADPWRGNSSYPLASFEDIWFENVVFVIYPEGGKELTALKLKEQDLRYIDDDTERRLLLDQQMPQRLPERLVDDYPGRFQYYKR
jgi:uncharacterized protein